MYHNFPYSTPEAQGVPSAAIAKWIRRIRSLEYVHSFMLLRHGHVIAEAWTDPYQPEFKHRLFSTTKSFTSAAIGFAMAEKRLTLDDKIVSFFPEAKDWNVSDKMKTVTIRNLLTMSSGHNTCAICTYLDNDGDPARKLKNWVKGFLESPLVFEPGTKFCYNSGCSYMLSAILRKITDLNLMEYLQPRLFAPLGIEPGERETCPMDIDIGGWGMKLRTADLAKYGQLLLQKGKWNGKQILPWEYFELATSKQISNAPENPQPVTDPEYICPDWEQGYGFQFWRCQNNSYRADGAFGQYIVVMPDQDMVLVATSGLVNMQRILTATWELILPELKERAITDNFCAQAEVASLCRSLHMPLQQGDLTKRGEDATYEFEENSLKIRSCNVSFQEDSCEFVFHTASAPEKLSAGFGYWKFSFCKFDDFETTRYASSAAWNEQGELELTVCKVETPFFTRIRFVFDDDKLTIHEKTVRRFRTADWPVLNATKK